MKPISEAFSLIANYATKQGWVPIGFRTFEVGPWTITVNGTQKERDTVPPFHALVMHQDVIGIMIVNPFAGIVGGWQDTEAEFCQAMSETDLTVRRQRQAKADLDAPHAQKQAK